MATIAIIDYGVGNLRSIRNGFERVGAKVRITNHEGELRAADALVLPGVGSFRDAMKNLAPLSRVVLDETDSGKPLLGICLGFQLLFTSSTEEGTYRGLDVFKGKVVRLPSGLKVPHIGWNTLKIVRPDNSLFHDVHDHTYVYFNHSYYANPQSESDVVTTTEYGISFASSVARGCVFATQFHPEKSGADGLRILRNFTHLVKR